MGKIRKVASIVGGIQCGLGGLMSVFAYLMYISPSVRDSLAITSEEVYLYIFLSLVLSLFSILSGLLLVYEKDSES